MPGSDDHRRGGRSHPHPAYPLLAAGRRPRGGGVSARRQRRRPRRLHGLGLEREAPGPLHHPRRRAHHPRRRPRPPQAPPATTSACTACSCSGRAPWRCTGTCTTTGPATGGRGRPRGKRMPLAIALGGESVLPYAATAPLPPGISELLFAGFLNGGGIPLVRCKTMPLWVPANAEIVIEGYVSAEAGFTGYDPRTRANRSAPAPSSKARSAITPASTPCPTGTRCSTSPRSPTGATRSTRPRSSACRRRRITSSARPPSDSSCRC